MLTFATFSAGLRQWCFLKVSEPEVHHCGVFGSAVCDCGISRTPDRDFRCFHPCEIILFYLTYPYQPVGEKKNEELYVGRTSISDAVVMLK